MGVTTLVVVSIISAAEVLFILNSVSSHALKMTLGQKVWIDVVYGMGMTIYMGLSGTISGVIIAAFSGFIMTLSLATAAGIVGTRKRKVLPNGKVIYIDYPPTITVNTIKTKALDLKDKAVIQFNELKQAA